MISAFGIDHGDVAKRFETASARALRAANGPSLATRPRRWDSKINQKDRDMVAFQAGGLLGTRKQRYAAAAKARKS